MTWLVASGVITGVGTLSVASWAEHMHGEAVAHTMALSFEQWLICLAVSASILVVSEVVKGIGRRSGSDQPVATVR